MLRDEDLNAFSFNWKFGWIFKLFFINMNTYSYNTHFRSCLTSIINKLDITDNNTLDMTNQIIHETHYIFMKFSTFFFIPQDWIIEFKAQIKTEYQKDLALQPNQYSNPINHRLTTANIHPAKKVTSPTHPAQITNISDNDSG